MKTLKPYSDLYGGKSGGLAKLEALGIKIPEGKVIPTKYLKGLEDTRRPNIKQGVPFKELSEYASRFWNEGRAVILRSSASQEDSTTASFAGQFKSSQEITDEESLLDGLIEVLEGFKQKNVAVYQQKIAATDGLNIGNIIIQEFIKPYVSGVIFGCNPINGDADVIQLSFTEGFGGRLVEGTEAGYSIVFDKSNGAVIQGHIPKEFNFFKEFLLEIAQTVELLETEDTQFFPDLEFVVSSDKNLYYVQWRPITTLSRIPPEKAGTVSFGREILMEWFSDRISPLFETLFFPHIFSISIKELKKHLGYQGKNPYYLIHNGFFYLRQELNLSLLISIFKTPVFLFRGVSYWKEKARSAMFAIAEYPVSSDAQSPEKLIEEIEKLVQINCQIIGASVVTAPIAYGIEAALRSVYNQVYETQSPLDYLRLIQKGESKSLQSQSILLEIGQAIRSLADFQHIQTQLKESSFSIHSITNADVRSLIAEFLNDYGHLSETFDIRAKTMREQTHWITNAIQMTEDTVVTSETEQESFSQLTKMKQKFKLFAPLVKLIIQKLARTTSQYHAIRDDRAFYAQYGWDKIRLRLLSLSTELQKQGVLSTKEQIFLTSWVEIKKSFLERDTGSDIGHLSLLEDKWDGRKLTPQLSINSPKFVKWFRKKLWYSNSPKEQENALYGQPGSPGTVTAKVAIVNTLAELENVSQGDILICSATTPAWTSAFGLLTGVITEVGNPLSHAAIVAREYNIPCVVGVTGAREKLRQGQTVKLIGSKGVIIKHPA